MNTSLTLQRARFPATRRLLIAFLLVFALGNASGFVVRSASAPAATSNHGAAVAQATAPCPSGSRVVVWYSAKAWGCVSDPYLPRP